MRHNFNNPVFPSSSLRPRRNDELSSRQRGNAPWKTGPQEYWIDSALSQPRHKAAGKSAPPQAFRASTETANPPTVNLHRAEEVLCQWRCEDLHCATGTTTSEGSCSKTCLSQAREAKGNTCPSEYRPEPLVRNDRVNDATRSIIRRQAGGETGAGPAENPPLPAK